jgi:hypothetical protein
MRIDLYGVKAAMLCEILTNNKKSSTRSNSFSWIFIFWSFTQDFEFSEFFSEAPYLPQSHGNLPCSHEPLQPSIGPGNTNTNIFFREVQRDQNRALYSLTGSIQLFLQFLYSL